MATKPFKYQPMFPLGPDTTEYYKLTSDYVKVENWGGHEFLVVDPQALSPCLPGHVPMTTHSCSVASTTRWWPRYSPIPKHPRTTSL